MPNAPDLDGVPNEASTPVAPAFQRSRARPPQRPRPYWRAIWAETVGPATPTRGRSLSRWETVYTMRYTLLVAKTVPVREFRTNLSALLSDVADRRDHVLVTRNGKPAAALVPIDEYDALEETAEILSDSETLAAIETGLAELSRGEVVTLADLRAELDAHRSTR